MKAQVVIAVRGGVGAKSRLRSALSPDICDALPMAMLQDMLAALALCEAVGEVLVVTPDEDLAAAAREAGARVVNQAAPGLNPAFEVGRAVAGPGPVVLLPGDLPLLDPVELAAALHAAEGFQVTLVPAPEDGGTGAVIIAPGVAFAPQFGQDSFARHVAQAKAAGLTLEIVEAPSLGFDLDRPEDVARVLAAGPATRTAALLG